MPNIHQIKKLAELIDFKGSVTIGLDNYRDKQYYYEQYRVSGDFEELDWIKNVFGGSVSSNGPHCKLIWRITADKALNVFRVVRPHLRHRQEAIDIAIEFGEKRQAIYEGIVVNSDEHKERKLEFVNRVEEYREKLKDSQKQVIIHNFGLRHRNQRKTNKKFVKVALRG